MNSPAPVPRRGLSTATRAGGRPPLCPARTPRRPRRAVRARFPASTCTPRAPASAWAPRSRPAAAARLTAGDEVQFGVGDFGGFHPGGEVHGGAFPSYRTMRRGMSVDFRHGSRTMEIAGPRRTNSTHRSNHAEIRPTSAVRTPVAPARPARHRCDRNTRKRSQGLHGRTVVIHLADVTPKLSAAPRDHVEKYS